MSSRSSLTFIERLWPRHGAHATTAPRERLWYALIVVAIVLAAGPELFAALDMIVLLDLLGAALFLTAYACGVKLTLTSCLRAVYERVVPSPAQFVLGSPASGREKLWAATYIVVNTLWSMGFAMACFAFGKTVARFVA